MTLTVLEQLVEECEIELTRNVSLWTNDSGVLAPDRALLADICLKDCGQQGQCVNGQLISLFICIKKKTWVVITIMYIWLNQITKEGCFT